MLKSVSKLTLLALFLYHVNMGEWNMFNNFKDKFNSSLVTSSGKPNKSLKDIGKVAVSLINNEFNRDEKTKKIINKALGTLEIDDLISNNPDITKMNFVNNDLVAKSINLTKKVDLVKRATTKLNKKSNTINTKDVHGSVNKKKVSQEKEKIPSNNIPKGAIGTGVVGALGALVLTGSHDEPEVVFDIRKSVSRGTIYAYENDDKTPVIEITAFDYKFDKDNVAGNKPSTNKIFTVVLPLQSGFDISHSANYSDYNSVWYRLSNALGGLGQDIVNFDSDKISELFALAGSETAINATTIGALTTLGNAMGLNMGQGGISAGFEYTKVATGTALNPMSISYYTNHNLIEHNFSFKLIPKNATDNKNIHKIITLLEEHQLAKMSDKLGGVMVSYPSVFQIQFKTHKNGKNINMIFDIPDSVLQNITVNWNGDMDFFSTNDDRNSPTSVTLNLSFKEMQMRTAVDMLALWR